jgi:hypothetical protein
MADTKISALPASTTPLAGTEVLPIVQGGATKQVSVANLTAGRAISATQLTLSTGNLIVASGQGIDFSATAGAPGATSELLNDYEEGTWTPTYTGWTVNPITDLGTYIKIGNQVTVSLLAHNGTSLGTSVSIGGLPFTSLRVGTATAHDFSDSTKGFNGLVWLASTSIDSISAVTYGSDYWTLTATYFV